MGERDAGTLAEMGSGSHWDGRVEPECSENPLSVLADGERCIAQRERARATCREAR